MCSHRYMRGCIEQQAQSMQFHTLHLHWMSQLFFFLRQKHTCRPLTFESRWDTGERTASKNNTRAHQHSPHQTIFGFVKKSAVFSESLLSRGFGLSVSGWIKVIFYENIKINDIKISFYKTLHLVQEDLVMRYIIVFPGHVEDSLL